MDNYDYLIDHTLGDSVNEMAYFISSGVKGKLEEAPLVTKKEFVNRAQVGDIIVAFTAKKIIKKFFTAKIYAKLMATFQGSPYTSSKIVLDDGTVGGYGVVISFKVDENVIGKVPLAQAVRARDELCLIRVKDANPEQRKKAAKFVQSKMGLKYADLDLYKSIWNRATNRKFLPFFKDKTLDKKQLETIQTPLFCSTLITVAYHVAGYKKKFNGRHPYDAWPRDFILADNTEKVCRIEY